MPVYDYDCAACGRRFEVIHGVHADRPTLCPLCGKGPIRKAISAAAVHYRGSGWAKKERRSGATAAASKASGDAPATGEGSAKAEGRADTPKDPPSASAAKPTEAGAAKPTEAGAAKPTD
jgi:putative FmdB family regulatory protein